MLSKTAYRQRGIHCKVPQTPVLGAMERYLEKRLCSMKGFALRVSVLSSYVTMLNCIYAYKTVFRTT